MKKLLQCLGAAIYGGIAGYLMWLLWYWLTPLLMSASWWVVILYVLIAGGLLSALLGGICNIIAIPLFFLIRGRNVVAKLLYIIPVGFYAFCSVKLPWLLDADYTVLQYIIAVALTINILWMYWAMLALPWASEE